MFFAAAFLALPLVAQSVFAKECTRKYTVKEGDICDSISAAQNVSTYQFSAINTDKIDAECTNLVPGAEYCLGYSGEDCSKTYVVVADDTCEGIATRHSFNTTILSQNNPQINTDCDNIYVGEVLCVSNSVQVPARPSNGALPGSNIPTTAAPANPKPTAPASPKPTSAPASPAPAPTAPPAHGDDNEDDDEENWPYCDEL